MGIEPTCRALTRHTGFEVRESHQRPFHFRNNQGHTLCQSKANNFF